MKQTDDFNWDTYSKIYEGQINNDFLGKGMGFIVDKYQIINDELVFADNLHVNWKEIYHLVHKLKVKSIYECGCGGAYNLINNQIINPNLKVNGCDYLQSQIDIGYKYFNLGNYEFSKRLKVIDMVNIDDINALGKHEFVYTQAVTMHLSYERAKKFLLNMKELSTKYIFLIENITMQDYDTLISEVFPEFERIIDNKYINNSILLKRKI